MTTRLALTHNNISLPALHDLLVFLAPFFSPSAALDSSIFWRALTSYLAAKKRGGRIDTRQRITQTFTLSHCLRQTYSRGAPAERARAKASVEIRRKRRLSEWTLELFSLPSSRHGASGSTPTKPMVPIPALPSLPLNLQPPGMCCRRGAWRRRRRRGRARSLCFYS